ncbi:amino acid permease [Scopulibacillus daqui]|uniref:amino acid permease n=1 Tax=Scopulibacillus daqui TaxID=1469162 RepID=UPI00195F919C
MNQSHSNEENLQRGLKNRHIQLIAIGGAIGTGLFFGAGKSIQLAGPSLMLTYLIVGVALFFVMRALGELILYKPTSGSFSDYAEELIGPWAGFITGWTYWFTWIATGIAEITAVGIYVKYWFPDVPQWIPALACVIVLFLINIATVKAFGEMEFWFAMIKIIAILALIVLGLVIIFTGFGNHGHPTGFSNLYKHNGFFPHGISGFLLAFQMAVFSFVGVELVGVTAGEAENPNKTIPKAVNNILIRILIFYIGALLIIMSIFPWDKVSPDSSPFVTVFSQIGIPAAAGIINFVVLTSAASSCNSGLFSTSRMLYSLAQNGQAPKTLSKLSERKVPAFALIVSTLALLIGVLLNYLLPDMVFTIVTSVATICFIWAWSIILISHMLFRRKMPEEARKIHFRMPLTPVMNWVVLGFFVAVIIILGFDFVTRISLFVTPVWFAILIIAYFMMKHKKRAS